MVHQPASALSRKALNNTLTHHMTPHIAKTINLLQKSQEAKGSDRRQINEVPPRYYSLEGHFQETLSIFKIRPDSPRLKGGPGSS